MSYKKGYTAPLGVAKEIVKCLKQHKVNMRYLDQIIVTSLTRFETPSDAGNDEGFNMTLNKCFYIWEDDAWELEDEWQALVRESEHFYDVDERPKVHTRIPLFILDAKTFSSPFHKNSG